MKMLLVSNMYPSQDDPIFGSFIENIEDGLVSNGVEVDKIVISGRGKSIFEKIIKYIKFYYKLFMIDLSKYDIVQVSYPTHSFFPFIFKKVDNTKILIRFHGDDLLHERSLNKVLKYITNRAIVISDLIVVPSRYFEKEFQKRYGDEKSIYVYPSGGLDTKKFYPMEQEKEIFTIGYVGRITEQKGVGVLIEAVSQLNFKYKLYIVGDGPDFNKYKKFSEEKKLNDKVIFTGAVKNNQLVNYYNLFDVFIFPTMRNAESFGNVAIEAMGCKIPLIGSKIAGLNDYLFNGKNGYFFNVGDTDDLKNKIETYYNLSDDKKDRMRESAYDVALGYEKKVLNQKFIATLRTLVE
jgi:glycosyltransferase involved in cell wall biosynthesis